MLSSLPQPLLIVGNPPWVTSSDLGLIKSANTPTKQNFQKHRGIDAITGKANFDISEWMLMKFAEWLRGKAACIAMLCKTAVARKVLKHTWRAGIPTKTASIYAIDAEKHFGAAVDACLLVIETLAAPATDCNYFSSLTEVESKTRFGYQEDLLVANVPSYLKRKLFLQQGPDPAYQWRSGVKHDCSPVMEIERQGRGYKNSLGETFQLEAELLYPLLKSSDFGNGRVTEARRYVIITQKSVGAETDSIRKIAPKTWAYLSAHKAMLDKRGSSIYRGKPPFSIFGIGPYSFAEWKVGISGFYKRLEFSAVGPIGQKPTMVDDTVYFLGCRSREEANFIAQLLNGEVARESLESLIFWADKRPITIDILRKLDLRAIARELGREAEFLSFSAAPVVSPRSGTIKRASRSSPRLAAR